MALTFVVGCSGGSAPSVELEGTATPDESSAEDSASSASSSSAGTHDVPSGGDTSTDGGLAEVVGEAWLRENTLSLRSALPLPYQGQLLSADLLATQLVGYDPGSLLRCAVADDASYRAAIDALGGVKWGYGVSLLEDHSKPRLRAGYERANWAAGVPGSAADDSAGVEIETPDIVAVTEAAALYYSPIHGLLVVSLDGEEPTFKCATQLPGSVNQFFFHDGHLVAMTRAFAGNESTLLHFRVAGSEVEFVEAVSLGKSNILDSRRFNDKLVFYTDLNLELPAATPPQGNGNPTSGASGLGGVPLPVSVPAVRDRALHVYRIGETLEREMFDTLMDTSAGEEQLFATVTPDTPEGTLVNESHWYGSNLWASDHYFVVTEQVTKTLVDHWQTDVYNVCTESHTVDVPYDFCWTEYETRPNPDYVEPDNSGGDRSCRGATLSDCLMQVARVANKTIEVPVGHKCEQRINQRWYCDAYEQRATEYPVYKHDHSTRLYIYEYTDTGFVRVDSQVHEIASAGLEAQPADALVDAVTTSTETFELTVHGAVQTLYFQNGYLYVISEGVLQVYAMGGGSIVRTATLPVVNETLQSSLFTDEQLFLSDFGYSWSAGDHSTLRVVDLSNPAFPKIEGSTHELPGGHRSIIASNFGIFTVGSVQQFMGQPVNALKLGLFGNPYAEETAYLILGTDLSSAFLGAPESQYFDGAAQRLLLPYSGQAETKQQFRVGLSHLEPGVIVSEGAVVVPEPVERVRRLPGADATYLTFAGNSIEWLTPDDLEWRRSPVLEYLVPSSVYRVTEANDYVEFQRLGERCRLYFANASDINQRANGAYSEEFACTGWPAAYANQLIFATGSVEFHEDHSLRLLSEEEVKVTRELIAQRAVCVLSDELVDNTYVDPKNLPEEAVVRCMTPQQYAERGAELSQASNN